jgi:hypothetical protein
VLGAPDFAMIGLSSISSPGMLSFVLAKLGHDWALQYVKPKRVGPDTSKTQLQLGLAMRHAQMCFV